MWAGLIASVIMLLLMALMHFMVYGLYRFTSQTTKLELFTASVLLPIYLGGLLVYTVLAGLWYGGTDIIKHYILRLILFHKGKAPRRFDHFLKYAVRLGFIHKVGGGYIFMHSLLRDYFADSVALRRKA